jgi:hypothetical protein
LATFLFPPPTACLSVGVSDWHEPRETSSLIGFCHCSSIHEQGRVFWWFCWPGTMGRSPQARSALSHFTALSFCFRSTGSRPKLPSHSFRTLVQRSRNVRPLSRTSSSLINHRRQNSGTSANAHFAHSQGFARHSLSTGHHHQRITNFTTLAIFDTNSGPKRCTHPYNF